MCILCPNEQDVLIIECFYYQEKQLRNQFKLEIKQLESQPVRIAEDHSTVADTEEATSNNWPQMPHIHAETEA